MKRPEVLLLFLLGLMPLQTIAATPWTEGTQYFRIPPAQLTGLPRGRVEVTEVFSYGCPACNDFLPIARAIKNSLPPNTQFDYLPAFFSPGEDFPLFERAFFTAQALGIADRMHQDMFDAVWKTGELAVIDPRTHTARRPLPTLEDIAMYFQRRAGIPEATFLKAAQSKLVDSKIINCDALILDYRVDVIPSIIVNRKYRINMLAVSDSQELIQLINWLVALESHAKP